MLYNVFYLNVHAFRNFEQILLEFMRNRPRKAHLNSFAYLRVPEHIIRKKVAEVGKDDIPARRLFGVLEKKGREGSEETIGQRLVVYVVEYFDPPELVSFVEVGG